MSSLAVRNKNGEKVHYTGTQFDGLENEGTHHLCVRTGTGTADIKKYALTSTPLNDKYKALKMRIPDNAGWNAGKEAYIAQRYSESLSTTVSGSRTTTRSSGYSETKTITHASTTTTYSTTSTTRGGIVSFYGVSAAKTSSMSSGGKYNGAGTTSKSSGTRVGTITVITASSATKTTTMLRSVTSKSSVNTVLKSSYWTSIFSHSNTYYRTTRATTTGQKTTFTLNQDVQSRTETVTASATRSSSYTEAETKQTTTSKLTNNVNL